MSNFPNIAAPSGFSETDLSFRLKETSAAGHTIIRGRGTATKKQFELDWKDISSADKDALQAFHSTEYGQSFSWTHLFTATVYTVCFEEDNLKFSYVSPGWWKLNLKLREI